MMKSKGWRMQRTRKSRPAVRPGATRFVDGIPFRSVYDAPANTESLINEYRTHFVPARVPL